MQGYIFTGVCDSVHRGAICGQGVGVWGGVGGGMRGSGGVYDREVCVAGVCMAGGHVWWGTCMVGGHAWPGGMCDMECILVWHGVLSFN